MAVAVSVSAFRGDRRWWSALSPEDILSPAQLNWWRNLTWHGTEPGGVRMPISPGDAFQKFKDEQAMHLRLALQETRDMLAIHCAIRVLPEPYRHSVTGRQRSDNGSWGYVAH